MACLLWIQCLIDILPQFLQWCMKYHVTLDHVIMALNCIAFCKFLLNLEISMITNRCPLSEILCMITFVTFHDLNGNIFHVTDLCADIWPVNSEFPSQRPVTWNFNVFFICPWINGSVNNCETGDLRCHCTHYDVTVMLTNIAITPKVPSTETFNSLWPIVMMPCCKSESALQQDKQ